MTYETVSESVRAYDELLETGMPIMRRYPFKGYATVDEFRDGDPIAYKCGWLDWCDAMGIDTDELEDDYVFESDR